MFGCPDVTGLIPEADLFHQTLNRLNFPDHQFLDVMDFRHRRKREAGPGGDREVRFDAMGRQFHLILEENSDVMSPALRIFTVDANGNQKPFTGFNAREYYAGKVAGSEDSQVTAHIDSDTGLLTASIAQDSDMYFIEPVARTKGQNSSQKMIMYNVNKAELALQDERRKLHDAIVLNETLPYNPSLENKAGDQDVRLLNDRIGGRVKRDADTEFSRRSRCSLRLVADHLFFKEHGSDVKQTVNYLVTLIDRINQIYLPTNWSDDDASLTQFGFVVQEIIVHEAPSVEVDHYNSRRDWTIREVLDAFSRDRNHKWFCLSHLFTHQRFESGVLGLAFVANLRKFVPGGICSQAVTKGQHTYYYNTGVTTTQNSFGKAIFTRITDLITAHEFGHNWGAEHDPDLEECSPRSGGYIMHTYSLAGYERNNKVFSPCSKRSIAEVLKYKSLGCFVSHRKSYCGNGIVDAGEECDIQSLSGEDSDPCCTMECRLKPGARCSDFNHYCCEGCQLKAPGSLCRERNANDCKEVTVCDGMSSTCPAIAPPVPDNSQCVDEGKCKSGACVPFCESIGMQSCLCNDQNNQCNRCCRRSVNSTCEAVTPTQRLSDGTGCVYGFCDKGECKKKTRDVITRIWQFMEHGSVNRFVKFMKDNIVFAVLCLCVIIWIPASMYYQKEDEKLKKEAMPSDHFPLSGNRSAQAPSSRSPESCGQGDPSSGNSYKSKRTIYHPRPYDYTGIDVSEFDTVDQTNRRSTAV